MSLNVDPVTIIARGGNGRILQFHDRPGAAPVRVRVFYCDGPAAAIRSQAEGAHLAVDPDKRIGDAKVQQHLRQPVHAMALGDPVQIQRQRRVFAHALTVGLQALMRRAAPGFHRRDDGLLIGGIGAEPPRPDGVAHADIEGAPADLSDRQPKPQHMRQLRRNSDPFSHRRRIEAHQVAVWLPGGHLRVHLGHGLLQRGLHRHHVEAGRSEEQRRPACSHGLPVQRVTRKVSRHPRHIVPPLSASPGSIPSWQGCHQAPA